ncbi:MAG: tetratricopeptide repeat protein [Planctomycetes bacterium]|nr:tetratricopeptide repeat protein [Planctomycetota bacterium]
MDVAKHLEKAAEAVRKKNFDYAVNLYHQVLQLKPDHGEARRELRQALFRRAEYKKVPPLISLLQGIHHLAAILVGTVLRNPNQVVLAAEAYLRHDPRHRGVNRRLAEALERAGHLNSAVAVWESVGDDERIGDHALKRAGMLYYSLKEMQKALACFETVLKRSPRDSEAEKMRKNLAAEGVLSSGSYDPSRSSRDLARDKAQRPEASGERAPAQAQSEAELLRAKLEQALAQNPADKRARRGLSDHLVRQRDYQAAAAVLEAGLALDASSYELSERLGDVRILDLEERLRDARARAAQGDEAGRTDAADLARELREFKIEEFGRRAAEHPTDLDLRFRLGRLLLEDEQVDPAIESFQLAVKDPRRRVDALLGLGAAFERKGMLDLARRQLETALESVDPAAERGTEIRYTLGVLLERSGDRAGARRCLESIYEQNINYKDIAVRLEALRSQEQQEIRTQAAAGAPAAEAERRADVRDDREGRSTYGIKD